MVANIDNSEFWGRCRSCRYFYPFLTTVNMEPGEAGECRLNPPDIDRRVLEFGWRVWPAVRYMDWCGKHDGHSDDSLNSDP
jgi:hypothetical protein